MARILPAERPAASIRTRQGCPEANISDHARTLCAAGLQSALPPEGSSPLHGPATTAKNSAAERSYSITWIPSALVFSP